MIPKFKGMLFYTFSSFSSFTVIVTSYQAG